MAQQQPPRFTKQKSLAAAIAFHAEKLPLDPFLNDDAAAARQYIQNNPNFFATLGEFHPDLIGIQACSTRVLVNHFREAAESANQVIGDEDPMRQQIIALTQQVQDLQNQNETLTNDNNNQNRTIANLNNQVATLTTQVSDLRLEARENTARAEERGNQVDMMRNTVPTDIVAGTLDTVRDVANTVRDQRNSAPAPHFIPEDDRAQPNAVAPPVQNTIAIQPIRKGMNAIHYIVLLSIVALVALAVAAFYQYMNSIFYQDAKVYYGDNFSWKFFFDEFKKYTKQYLFEKDESNQGSSTAVGFESGRELRGPGYGDYYKESCNSNEEGDIGVVEAVVNMFKLGWNHILDRLS